MAKKYSFTIVDCEAGLIRFIEDESLNDEWDYKFQTEKNGEALDCTLVFNELEKRHQFLELLQENGFYIEETEPDENLE